MSWSKSRRIVIRALVPLLVGGALVAVLVDFRKQTEVVGSVRVKGSPAASGTLTFTPRSGFRSPVVVSLDPEGSFATRMPTGRYQLEVLAQGPTDQSLKVVAEFSLKGARTVLEIGR
jgi:hypothetical protein